MEPRVVVEGARRERPNQRDYAKASSYLKYVPKKKRITTAMRRGGPATRRAAGSEE